MPASQLEHAKKKLQAARDAQEKAERERKEKERKSDNKRQLDERAQARVDAEKAMSEALKKVKEDLSLQELQSSCDALDSE